MAIRHARAEHSRRHRRSRRLYRAPPFVLRAPDNEPDRKWRRLERLLPAIAIVLAALMLLTSGNLTGYRTETGTRFAILAGFAVAVFAVGILLEDTAQTTRGFSAHALGD